MNIEKIQEEIEKIDEEIKETPYHKGTEHHIGKLKAKLAKLRLELEKGVKKKTGEGFAIKKEGDATLVLVGLPSVGKSTLLNKLTRAKAKVASYPFTTLKVIPGMLDYKGAKIQVLDIPGLISGATKGKGKGKQVLSVVRIADLLLLLASVEKPTTFKLIEKELHLAGVRMNEKRPQVFIEKKGRGGIQILGKKPELISTEVVKSLAREFGILNADIVFKENINQDQLIDVFLENRVYVPGLRVLSKIDLVSKKQLKNILNKIKGSIIPISTKEDLGLKKLKEEIFSKLNFIRIYLRKTQKTKPEKKPLICKKGTTVLEAAKKISEELAKEIKGAKIQGLSVKYPNQLVGLEHQFSDRDIVFFVKI